MKIHYLVTSLESGGAEFAIPDIIQTLYKYNCQVQITVCEPRDMVAAQRLDAANIPYTLMFNEKRNKLAYVLSFLKILRQNRPDVIWTSLSTATFVGQIAGKILGIPVVSWKHSAAVKKYTQLMRNLTHLWVTDSSSVSEFTHKIMQIPLEKIVVWPLFYCEVDKIAPLTWRAATPLRIGSIGRLHKQKNYPLFLEGIALFRKKYPQYAEKIIVSILGEGPERDNIENKINELALNDCVRLLGYSSDIYGYLKTLDLYAQPSSYEGMCKAAHEALSTGLPLLATPVGEIQTTLNHDTGFSLEETDIPEGICAALKTIFDDPSILEKKSKNALDYMHHYYSKDAFEKAGKKVLERIESLILSKTS